MKHRKTRFVLLAAAAMGLSHWLTGTRTDRDRFGPFLTELASAETSGGAAEDPEAMGPSFGDWRRLDPSAVRAPGVEVGVTDINLPPTDLRTTNNGSSQNETSIAADPNNPNIVVGGFNDYNLLSSGFAGNGVVYSTDGGNTFTYHTTGVPQPAGFTNSGGDPALAFDSRGRVFYAFISAGSGGNFTKSSGIFVARSDDGGVNWNADVTVASNVYSGTRVNFEDKEFIDVDRNVASPFRDRVYISWTRFYEGNYPGTGTVGGGDIMFSSSSDGGQNWTAPIRLSDPAALPTNGGTNTAGTAFVQGSEPEVAADGSVYVAFKFRTYTAVRRSTDGGVTFGAATFPFGTGNGSQVVDHDGNANNGTQIPGWSFRVNSFANIETHPTLGGQVYIVASDDPTDDATGDGGNIVFARSTDFGATWGGSVTLNDDGGTSSQIFPWMAVNAAGVLEVIWYDARNTSGANTVDVYAICSGDGGANFSANFRVTDQTFNPNTGQFAGNTFFGDYNSLGAGTTDFHALWTDGRNGEQEIYYDRPACCAFDRNPPDITCPADVTVECSQSGGTPASDPQLASFFAGVSATDDCDGSPALTNNAPAFFPSGTTIVTFTATDDSGNASQCAARVTVADTTPPVIRCPVDLTFECDAVGAFGSPTATDICDADPVITLIQKDSIPGACPHEYRLVLTYQAEDDAGNTSTCQQTITVEDTTAPVITCPTTLHFEFTSPTEAVVTFVATATDNCGTPTVTCDPPSGTTFGVGYHTVLCIADDGCGNKDSCSFRFLIVPLDVKPGSCPNPLNARVQGTLESDLPLWIRSAAAVPDEAVVPMAVLGRDDINVRDINPETIEILGLASKRWAYSDVATPVANDPSTNCECTTKGRDGWLDLTLKFDRAALVAALGPVTNGEYVMLLLTGNLFDGTWFAGGDCVLIRAPKSTVDAEPPVIEPFGAANHPNPFNAATTISYSLSDPGHVRLEVFNILGQRMTTLVDAFQEPGQYDVVWDGRDASDETVASGIYFYRLQAGTQVLNHRMALLK